LGRTRLQERLAALSDIDFNQPLGGNTMPRFGGPATMFRLPSTNKASDVDVAIVGVPLDVGTSYRSGARFGPREVRAESAMIRPYGMATRAAPFESFQVADVGDVPLNTYNLQASIGIIENFYNDLLKHDVLTLSVGGDHTITLPILRAHARKHGKMALIHIDAHADINDEMFGEKIAHGTVFRRALEEELLDGSRMFQIGLRGTGYSAEDFDWARNRGVTIVEAHECWNKSLDSLMHDVRKRIGPDTPTYLTFDIDGLDPSVAPGTGTPEPGGLTTAQGIQIIRGAFGTSLVGADIVEVSPPYDTTGNTSLLAANLLFEMLCSFPGCIRRR
jgi:guanidinobutyrase